MQNLINVHLQREVIILDTVKIKQIFYNCIIAQYLCVNVFAI